MITFQLDGGNPARIRGLSFDAKLVYEAFQPSHFMDVDHEELANLIATKGYLTSSIVVVVDELRAGVV